MVSGFFASRKGTMDHLLQNIWISCSVQSAN
uniref:Uncharacterized protein n=1 Tax=Arundo donax TaxID=35708 RepID=A0A0A9BAE4_ARUDO